MSIVAFIVDVTTKSGWSSFLLPRALAIVTKGPTALPDSVAPTDLLSAGDEVEPLLRVAGHAVEDEAEQPAGVGLVLVASDVVEHPLHHLELVERQAGHWPGHGHGPRGQLVGRRA